MNTLENMANDSHIEKMDMQHQKRSFIVYVQNQGILPSFFYMGWERQK